MLESLVVLEDFEYFEETRNPQESVKSRESHESQERVVVFGSAILIVQPMLQ